MSSENKNQGKSKVIFCLEFLGIVDPYIFTFSLLVFFCFVLVYMFGHKLFYRVFYFVPPF